MNPINDAPIGEDLNLTLNEDETARVVFTPFDADGDVLSIEIGSLPTSGTLEATFGNPLSIGDLVSGTLELDYIPSPNSNGADSFTFFVTDGVLDSAVFSVNLDVQPVNDPPVATALTLNTLEDAPIAITLL